jgi:exopolysaccharide biosynthesis predicted pyruvyltransferase EpsI
MSGRYNVVGIYIYIYRKREKLKQKFITKYKIIKIIALGSSILWAQMKHWKKIKRHDISQNMTLYIATRNSVDTGSSV